MMNGPIKPRREEGGREAKVREISDRVDMHTVYVYGCMYMDVSYMYVHTIRTMHMYISYKSR